MKQTIRFRLNGQSTQLEVDDERTLLWVLRHDLGLTGTKFGCGEGLCGACTVVLGKKAVRSCQVTMKEVAGKDLLTIEGLAKGDELHPLQQQFVQHDALQCGFCTSGMILNAYGLLQDNPHPTRQQIIADMDENLCRCGAHKRILEAIESASKEM